MIRKSTYKKFKAKPSYHLVYKAKATNIKHMIYTPERTKKLLWYYFWKDCFSDDQFVTTSSPTLRGVTDDNGHLGHLVSRLDCLSANLGAEDWMPCTIGKGNTLDSPPPRLRGVTDGNPPDHVAKSSYVEPSPRG